MADEAAQRVALSDVDFFDPATNDCPYHAYRTLREEAPVWFDERTRMWVLTRYDDVKAAARDPERFSSVRPRGTSTPTGRLTDPARAGPDRGPRGGSRPPRGAG